MLRHSHCEGRWSKTGGEQFKSTNNKQMKNIVCFHLFNDYSGSPKVLKSVLEGLADKGYRIDLVTSHGGILDELKGNKNIRFTQYRYRFSDNGIITMLRYTWIQLVTFLLAFRYLFKKDVVFYINTILPIGPALAGKITGKRVVYHYHENAMVKSAFYRTLAWFMQKLADSIICVSKYQRSFLKREKGINVVPNALQETFARKLMPDSEKAFEQQRILMLGSLKGYKGTIEFITIASHMNRYRFELVINDSQENIDKFLKERNIGLTENITIYSRQEDVTPFYNRASLILNLTNKKYAIETFGLTALEAMTAGLPVIVPTVGGIAEMVEDGVNGYRIDVTDIKEIEEKTENILKSKKLYLHLSQNALECSRMYSSECMIESIEKFIC